MDAVSVIDVGFDFREDTPPGATRQRLVPAPRLNARREDSAPLPGTWTKRRGSAMSHLRVSCTATSCLCAPASG